MGAFFQGNELWIILLILLLILGPTKLPALARGLGQAIREFKKASQGVYDEETKEKKSEKEVDDKLLMELAKKLEVSTEGKSKEELKKEVLEKAKEKGLI
ncbi:MAG: twin-arginine translocase TatA/TatE family subunit [Desulfurococcales archaeon]|nr:twin-arginine translocase TatA/TatE family subunit [Desulfurococcales archaeon]MCE4622021.1 twin-arginine translocase TatA/TatE family subunit [Desulfurococcales archaeon]